MIDVTKGRKIAAWALLGLAAFALGYSFDRLTVRGILLGAFAVLSLVVVALPYRWAITVLFAYLGFEGMAKLLTGYHPVVHVGADLLVGALAARVLFSFLLRRIRLPDRRPPLLPLFIAHFAWFFIAFANPYSLSLFASLAGLKVYVTMVLLYFFGYYLATGAPDVRRFVGVWAAVAAIQVVTSLLQAWKGPESVLALSPAYAGPLRKYEGLAFRPFGTTAIPGGSTVFVFLAAPFIVYFMLHARRLATRVAMMALLPLAGLMLLLCQVRASLLKAILGSALFVLEGLRRATGRQRARLLAFGAAAAIVMIAVLPRLTSRWVELQGESASAIERSLTLFDMEKARTARSGAFDRIVTFAKMVPLGAGLSRTGAAAGKFAADIQRDPFFNSNSFFTDNFWAATIVDLGIPGSLIITAIVGAILAGGFLGSRRIRSLELSLLHAAILSSLTAMVVGFWGAEGLLYNPEAAFFWFFAGVLMRLPELSDAPAPPPANPRSARAP
jgi:hypothetical protein